MKIDDIKLEEMDILEFIKLKRTIEVVYVTRKDEAAKKFKEMVDAYGITAEDLGFAKGRKKSGNGTRAKPKPKYQNPENPAKTWSGRGKPPKWMQAYLEGGKEKEEFLIDGDAQ